MGYVIRHSTGSINRARKKGNVAFGVSSNGYDKTSVSGLYNGVPPVVGKHNLVRVSSTNDPDFYALSNAELINFANQLGGGVNSVTDAQTFLNARDDIMFTDELPDNTVVNGLLFDFDFTSLNTYPGSGVVYYDLSGNNYHASASSDITYVEYDSNLEVVNFKGGEVSGQGLFVQGLNYVTGNSDQLEELTIDTLIKTSTLSSNSNDQRIILSFDRSSVFRFSVGGDSGAAPSNPGKLSFMSPQTGDKSATNCPDLRDDKWHRIAVTFKSGTGNGLRYYVDGELVETDTSTYSPIGSQGTSETPRYGVIGAGSESTSGQPGDSTAPDAIFTGSMASIKYYNTQLSQTEILQNYYGGDIVTDGLTFAIDAGSLVSYESGSTIVYPMTGSVSGSLANGPTFNSMNGGVLEFDGTDDRLTFPHNSEFDVSGPFSIDLWFYGGNGIDNYGGLFCKSGNGNFGNWGLYGSSGNDYVRFGYVSSNSAQQECSNASYSDISTPGWYYYCGTYDGSTLRLYRNGIQIASSNPGATHLIPGTTTTDVGFGWRPASSAYEVNYKVGAARLYNNKALTADEVLQNYNAQKARFS